MVTDTMAAAVTHCSRDSEYVWVSRRYAEWIGITPEALAGRPIGGHRRDRRRMRVIRPRIERVLAGRAGGVRRQGQLRDDRNALDSRGLRADLRSELARWMAGSRK